MKFGGKCRPPVSTINISGGGLINYSEKFGFGDTVKVNNILNVMVNSQPRVRVTMYNQQNAPIYVACYSWDMLDHSSGFNVQGATYFVDSYFAGPPNVVIDGNAELKGHISVTMNPNQLANAGKVEMKVIPVNQCPR